MSNAGVHSTFFPLIHNTFSASTNVHDLGRALPRLEVGSASEQRVRGSEVCRGIARVTLCTRHVRRAGD
jgi:hypothetical protein